MNYALDYIHCSMDGNYLFVAAVHVKVLEKETDGFSIHLLLMGTYLSSLLLLKMHS